MNIINLEIYSLLILFILYIDYRRKYSYKENTNSIIYYTMLFTITLVSILNILLFHFTFPNDTNFILLTIGCTLLVIPSLSATLYIKTNFFFQEDKTNTYSIICIAYLILYLFFMSLSLTITATKFPIDPKHILDFAANTHLSILIILPLFYTFVEGLIRRGKFNDKRMNSVLFGLLIPIVGVILDAIFPSFSFAVPAYTILMLIIYLYRNNVNLTMDPLTGLYNKRAIFDKIYTKSPKKAQYMAVYLIDIDEFKSINDTYGHNYGDVVLKSIAKIIRSSIRNSDYPIRIGGDEFLIIAYLTDIKHIDVIVKNIEKNLKEYNDSPNIKTKVSLSIGSEIYDNKTEFTKFVNKVDNKMYKEKHSKKRRDIIE